ncbi:hypothetical protein Ahy_A04g019904 [Arachis hypogaea]|uniref:Uncharacterized protein n=1 Tax=Arachis hypogaea TaxID=3818 RepID=A0A445DGR6_ARAHY|nr:hypothetical protein Ahy_A04g019904 [Arachis hypogaea]
MSSESQRTEDYRILDDFDGTIKLAKLSVKKAMERPNSRRIMLKFNNKKQPIGDEVGLLNGESWHKITTKDKVYNECIKQNFHFDEDSEGTIKKNILKSIGKSCKDTKLRSYDAYYDPTSTTKQNIENRPSRINREDWRWYLDYRNYLYVYILLNCVEYSNDINFVVIVETTRRRVNRRELWITVHKKNMIPISMMKQVQLDDSSRVLSQNDSISQVLEKEKPGRVCDVNFGSTPSQLFGPNSHPPDNGV